MFVTSQCPNEIKKEMRRLWLYRKCGVTTQMNQSNGCLNFITSAIYCCALAIIRYISFTVEL